MSNFSGTGYTGNPIDQRRQPLSTNGGYSNPGGMQNPVGSVYGQTPVQIPAWGGPQLRWGDVNPGVNAGYAGLAMPGTPPSYQQMFSGLAGTPWSSNPNQYGRWNWAQQMPQQTQQPGMGYPPPGGQPPPYQPQQPAPYQPPAQQQPQPGGVVGADETVFGQPPGTATGRPLAPNTNGQFGGAPSAVNPYAGGNGQVPYSQAAINNGMTYGDIWSNPMFANMVAAGGGRPGGGIFG